MKNKLKRVFTSLFLVMALVVCSAIPAFAAEVPTSESSSVESASTRAVKTLPAGQTYTILSNLSFTDQYTLASEYYVQGRWLNLNFGFRSASGDLGVSGVKLTVMIYDAYTGELLASDYDVVPDKTITGYPDMTFDLGTFGRTVKIKFDASSYGESNGHYRSATIVNLNSYVFG